MTYSQINHPKGWGILKMKEKLKVLNLYAGIGGNRKLWDGDIEVTAIEIRPKIAKQYQKHFPNDKVIVDDAHQYLIKHYKEFDFIWSSPPCPSHSKIRMMASKVEADKDKNRNTYDEIFPDMKLYEEIIFLDHYFKGKWVVENVISYYEPLIKPQKVGKHFFWSNFIINQFRIKSRNHMGNIDELQNKVGFDLDGCDLGHRKDQVLRNCVEPKLGKHIFDCAFRIEQKLLSEVSGNSS